MRTTATPRVLDNDRDEITVMLDGKELRGWSYRDEAERRTKMLAAREFCEGWHQAAAHPLPSELIDALQQCADYFDGYADADHDGTGFVPNDEMALLTVVNSALEQAGSRS